ncbi:MULTISPECIES: hypothetical protein [unclassified Leucobacter]|uniref:hypothetical protein n=1 Tax=unclassified Leucobacter TaxID=2621730 RepID=UPI000620F686|nr:hypothetical protein [Leucobacter sp. Ag1]KKI17218.1 hypothetical protein XM48_11740 [Leucobacter sp. Ag1]
MPERIAGGFGVPNGAEFEVGGETFLATRLLRSHIAVSMRGTRIAEVVRTGQYWQVSGLQDGDRSTRHRSFAEALTAASSRY